MQAMYEVADYIHGFSIALPFSGQYLLLSRQRWGLFQDKIDGYKELIVDFTISLVA
jgi:hypothetical protein